MDDKAFKYLEPINPDCWPRHAFETNCKSDMISNNIANSWIKDVRYNPLVTMLERILGDN